MVAANLFDHPVILIVIAAVTLLRWIAQRAKTEKDNSDSAPPPPPPSQPIPRGGESQTEEERIRRFLEALGQPRGTTPSAPVAPRRREVLQRRINPLLPPLTTVPPPMPQSPVMTRPPPLPKEEIIQGVTELPIETRAAGSAVKGLSLNLGSAQDLRSAIVLREIFGPPRSLQPIDSIIGS